MKAIGCNVGLRERSSRHAGVEELGEGRDSFDGDEVKVGPRAEVAHIPPKVEVFAAAEDSVDFEDEVDRGVRGGEVRLERGGGVVGRSEEEFGWEILVDWRVDYLCRWRDKFGRVGNDRRGVVEAGNVGWRTLVWIAIFAKNGIWDAGGRA